MLVAYGPNGRPIVAEETPLEQLQHWSHERVLCCPNCRGIVHVRGGPDKQMQLHFAHQRGECAWSTESESLRHARGKLVLAQWLREQFPEATIRLEERLPEPNRIADIFVAHADGQRWAIEFQCAPLDVEEWRHRHQAYRKAGIIDSWIIGANRREKQEAFIEAIIATAHEVLFLDPLLQPTHTWLRWPVSREIAQEWHGYKQGGNFSLDGWVGHRGYGAVVKGTLDEVYFDEQAFLHHPLRMRLESRTQLLQAIRAATSFQPDLLVAYMRQSYDATLVQEVLQPLTKSYIRDPDLLRRYNYGRGIGGQAVTEADRQRIAKAKQWLSTLAERGFPAPKLAEMTREIPFVGPYAAFASYIEMLLSP